MFAKHFTLDFDGGRSAPYHIKERRGKFVGSLWLGFKGLQWLLTEWATLRSCADLKGFFRFYHTGYSILEFNMASSWSWLNIMVGLNVVVFKFRKVFRAKDGTVSHRRSKHSSWIKLRRRIRPENFKIFGTVG